MGRGRTAIRARSLSLKFHRDLPHSTDTALLRRARQARDESRRQIEHARETRREASEVEAALPPRGGGAAVPRRTRGETVSFLLVFVAVVLFDLAKAWELSQ
jgi:hypothetical protein